MRPANDNHTRTFISMFSGIEAASVAFGPLCWKPICFAEIEKFPSAVLAHHYPDVPNVGDMSQHDWSQYRGKVDVVCGGPPCQAFSVAGLRNSMADARGNLSLVYMRALHAIKPRNAIVENVPGWLSTKDNAFGCFLAGLVGASDALPPPPGGKWPGAGMVSGPKGRAAWRVLDAQYFGVAQRRRRVIVVADFGNGADPAEVLFELEGVQRHSPPSREKGKGFAATISARTKGGGGLGTDFDLDGGLVEAAVAYGGNRTSGPIDVSPALAAHPGPHGRQNFESEAFLVQPVAATLDASFGRLHGASGQDANHGHSHLVPVCIHADAIGRTGDAKTPSLDAAGVSRTRDPGMGINADGTSYNLMASGQAHAICFSAKDYGADASVDIAPTLRAGGHTSSHANAGVMPAVAFAENSRSEVRLEGGDGQTVGCLGAGGGKPGQGYPAVLTSAVRRLTPKECERLQGFPDDYTLIPIRKVSKANQNKALSAIYNGDDKFKVIDGEVWVMSADGPRYKALGNSWAVPKFAWLGKRLDAALRALDEIEVREAA